VKKAHRAQARESGTRSNSRGAPANFLIYPV